MKMLFNGFAFDAVISILVITLGIGRRTFTTGRIMCAHIQLLNRIMNELNSFIDTFYQRQQNKIMTRH